MAIDHLTPYASEKLDADTAGTIHYLLGTSKFNITFQDIQQCRDGGTQKKDALQDHQIGPLKEALQHFRMVYEIAPQHSMAAESLYMAGRALDWGCLQRFQEALDSYSLAFENFPEQEFGKKARQRYDILNAKMSPHGKKPSIPHRPMGTTKGSTPH